MYIERCKHGLERGLCKPTSATMHGGTCLLYISYAAQYKSSGYDDTTKKAGVDIKPMSDITLTFLRITKPEKLLSYLENHGFSLSQKFAGVYYVSGVAELKIQIVVGSELEGDEFVPLRVQKENAAEDNIRKFIEMCGELSVTAVSMQHWDCVEMTPYIGGITALPQPQAHMTNLIVHKLNDSLGAVPRSQNLLSLCVEVKHQVKGSNEDQNEARLKQNSH